MIVNTATKRGFIPQYDELEEVYKQHFYEDLEILDSPCNQFAQQAPGNNDEIHSFCKGNFGITFPQFAKVYVNEENAISLFQWLVNNTVFEGLILLIHLKNY